LAASKTQATPGYRLCQFFYGCDTLF